MLGSLGMIAGALVIRYTGWSVNVLLEGVPDEVSIQAVETTLRADEEVLDVHDLHVWSLSSSRLSLSAHVMLKPGAMIDPFLADMRSRLASEFEIHHSTLQCEYEPCGSGPECLLAGEAEHARESNP